MPLTQLDAGAALVLIDLQKGILGLPGMHSMRDIIARAAELAQAFREAKLPVALVNVTGVAPGRTDAGRLKLEPSDDWAEFVPELEKQPADLVVTKQRWGAFLGTNLDELLRARQVTQIFLAGVATSIGVESTARSAYDLGYNVVLIPDAMTDLGKEAHQHTVANIFPRLGEVETAGNVIRLVKANLR